MEHDILGNRQLDGSLGGKRGSALREVHFRPGIGVDPAHRGHGLGKLLFCKLCAALRDEGAAFMTLFTGENNPARNIYEAAGMRVVRCFSCMRKVIK